MDISEIRKIIKETKFCMLNTNNQNGQIDSRPMLTVFHNSEEEHIFFFCMKNSQKIIDLRENNHISLSYQDNSKENYIHIIGKADITEDVATMQSKWDKQLNTWWPNEAQTEGMSMIKVKINSIRYWTKDENGTITIN